MVESIYNIYKLSYTVKTSRGKLRQHKINSAIISYLSLKEEYKKCTFKTEVSVESWWSRKKTFCIDVVVYDENGVIITLVLGKAPASNITQNETNLMGIRVSEILRVKEKTKMIFINFQPNTTPFFKGDGKVKHCEKNKVEFIPNGEEMGLTRDFDEIYITFDIDGISNSKTREDVERIFECGNPIKNISIKESSNGKPKICS